MPDPDSGQGFISPSTADTNHHFVHDRTRDSAELAASSHPHASSRRSDFFDRRAPKLLFLAAVLLATAISALFAQSTSTAQADGGPVIAGQCAITSDGRIVCWGGEEGVPTEGSFTQISGTAFQGCALSDDGTISCWPSGRRSRFHPLPPSGDDFVWVSTGKNVHACGITAHGGVVCEGNNFTARSAGAIADEPPFGRYTQVSAGFHHTCALTDRGSIRCWGRNENGQLESPDSGKYVQLSSHGDTSCALKENGSIECWGANGEGQTDAPTDANYATINIRDYPCAITLQGGIVCWGTEGTEAVASSGYTFVSRIGNTVCAITTESALECFGGGNVVPPAELTQPGSVLQPQYGTPSVGRDDSDVPAPTPETTRLVTATRLIGPTGGSISSAVTEGRATITATADDGYRFLRWDGDASGTRNPLTITLSDHVFVTAIFEPIEPPESDRSSVDSRRTDLFATRILPEQTWQVGQPLNVTLPAATGGSGFINYSIKYEWNQDQTWTPSGVTFNPHTRRFSGIPSMTLNPNPNLRRFTVYLRANDRLRTGEWDELAFIVNLRPAPTAEPTPTAPDTLTARVVARRLADGRIEFALQPTGVERILPRSRTLSASPPVDQWRNTSDVVYEGQTLGRISARRLANGRTEFGFLPASGAERVLPRSRTFPSGSTTTDWLRSSAIEIPIPSHSATGPRPPSPEPEETRQPPIPEPEEDAVGEEEERSAVSIPPGAPQHRISVSVRARFHSGPGEIEIRVKATEDGDDVDLRHHNEQLRRIKVAKLGDGAWRSIRCLPLSNWNCVSPVVRSKNGRYEFAIRHLGSPDVVLLPRSAFGHKDFQRKPLIGDNWKTTGTTTIPNLSGQLYGLGSERPADALLKARISAEMLRYTKFEALLTYAADPQLRQAYADYLKAKRIVDEAGRLKKAASFARYLIDIGEIFLVAIEYPSRGVTAAATIDLVIREGLSPEHALFSEHKCGSRIPNAYKAPDAYLYMFQQVRNVLEVIKQGTDDWKDLHKQVRDSKSLNLVDAMRIDGLKRYIRGTGGPALALLESDVPGGLIASVRNRALASFAKRAGTCFANWYSNVQGPFFEAASYANDLSSFDRELRSRWVPYARFARGAE